MQDELRKLITRHCETLVTELTEVGLCLKKLNDAGGFEDEILAEGLETTHKIKGSSGTIGFPDISAAAKALEARLKEARAAAAPLSKQDWAEIAPLYKELHRLVHTATPEASTLYNVQLPNSA